MIAHSLTHAQVNYLPCLRNSKQIKYDELIKTTTKKHKRVVHDEKKLRSDALRKLKGGSERNTDREVEL